MDVSKSQAMVAAEAIPVLQMLMKTCPPSFHDRADSLLHCLPGCLTVTIKRANNLKQVMGGTNAFCQLTIGNGPSRQTKVMSQHFIIVEYKGFCYSKICISLLKSFANHENDNSVQSQPTSTTLWVYALSHHHSYFEYSRVCVLLCHDSRPKLGAATSTWQAWHSLSELVQLVIKHEHPIQRFKAIT